MGTNKILNAVCVELEILSGKTSHKELQKYENDMKQYHKELQRAESMAMSVADLEEPEEPDMRIEYRKQWFNMANIELHSWYNDWDEERQCEIVVFDYSNANGFDQLNVKIKKNDWIKLLEDLGASHITVN